VEKLGHDDKPSFDEKQVPEVELKPLSSSLRYEFLSPNSTYPIYCECKLKCFSINSLNSVLKMYHKNIGYTLDDIKRIHPSVCMHLILMDNDHSP